MSDRLQRLRVRLAHLWSEPVARLLAIVLVLAPAVVLLAVALLPSSRGPSPRLLRQPITVAQSLSPTTALFGDRLEAEIDVYTDDERIDPASVQLDTDFRPYEVVSTAVDRSSQGSVSLLHTRVSLSCLSLACLAPGANGRLLRFMPATVTYRQGAKELTLRHGWSDVRVYSRLGQSPRLVERPPSLDTRFRVSPTVARVGLAVVAAALALVGAAFVVSGFWPRFPYSLRQWRRLSPLEQALAQLDAAARIDDEQTRRRVLDQLATELGERELTALERRSRALAWGEQAPETESLDILGEQVRRSLNGGVRR